MSNTITETHMSQHPLGMNSKTAPDRLGSAQTDSSSPSSPQPPAPAPVHCRPQPAIQRERENLHKNIKYMTSRAIFPCPEKFPIFLKLTLCKQIRNHSGSPLPCRQAPQTLQTEMKFPILNFPTSKNRLFSSHFKIHHIL